jgi:hypothetical protein
MNYSYSRALCEKVLAFYLLRNGETPDASSLAGAASSGTRRSRRPTPKHYDTLKGPISIYLLHASTARQLETAGPTAVGCGDAQPSATVASAFRRARTATIPTIKRLSTRSLPRTSLERWLKRRKAGVGRLRACGEHNGESRRTRPRQWGGGVVGLGRSAQGDEEVKANRVVQVVERGRLWSG